MFNYAVHSFVLLIFALYDNDLKLEVESGEYRYLIVFVVLLVVELYLWEIAGTNPGILSY